MISSLGLFTSITKTDTGPSDGITKGGTDDMLEGRAAVQWDLDRCEEWDDSNLMKISKV